LAFFLSKKGCIIGLNFSFQLQGESQKSILLFPKAGETIFVSRYSTVWIQMVIIIIIIEWGNWNHVQWISFESFIMWSPSGKWSNWIWSVRWCGR